VSVVVSVGPPVVSPSLGVAASKRSTAASVCLGARCE